MEVTIDNIAKIEHAKICLNGITVIAGYNGTGKSSISKAIYSMLRASNNIEDAIANEKKNDILRAIGQFSKENNRNVISRRLIKSISNMDINKVNTADLEKLLSDYSIATTPSMLSAFKLVLDTASEEYSAFIAMRTLDSCFWGQIGNLNLPQEPFAITISNKDASSSIKATKQKILSYECGINIAQKPLYISTGSIKGVLGQGTIYEDDLKAAISVPRSQRDLFTLQSAKEQESVIEAISAITHGKLQKDSILEDFFYFEDGINAPIDCNNIASGLKHFLIIQKLISNGVFNNGGVLIIDEPEVNLHPDYQIKFAKVLITLHKKLGVTLLINTHSPYFMASIDGCVCDDKLKDRASYYFTMKSSSNRYTVQDVTQTPDVIYKTMYKPLEGFI